MVMEKIMKALPLQKITAIKRAIRSLAPTALLNAYRSVRDLFLGGSVESRKRKLFEASVDNVDAFVKEFRSIPEDRLLDEAYMERFIIEKIGLNDEALHEQPPELGEYYGKGLFLWQNPKQFSKFIVWLLKNAKTSQSYAEIGCRWGGTFIVICEALYRANPDFKWALAVDLIRKTPFIERYEEIARQSGFEIEYFQGFSTSKEFGDLIRERKPDVSFIDGDHSLAGALKDHMLVRPFSKIIIHHDISSESCPETGLLWNCLKELESDRKTAEFIEQYPSVGRRYLGIGVLYS
jgi:hypothetical protein